MDHTRMRFETMTERELWTRLGRVTNEHKLRCFEALAREYSYMALSRAARNKYESLYYRDQVSTTVEIQQRPKPKTKKRSHPPVSLPKKKKKVRMVRV